jgi:hypothetical protein
MHVLRSPWRPRRCAGRLSRQAVRSHHEPQHARGSKGRDLGRGRRVSASRPAMASRCDSTSRTTATCASVGSIPGSDVAWAACRRIRVALGLSLSSSSAFGKALSASGEPFCGTSTLSAFIVSPADPPGRHFAAPLVLVPCHRNSDHEKVGCEHLDEAKARRRLAIEIGTSIQSARLIRVLDALSRRYGSRRGWVDNAPNSPRRACG